MSGFAHVKITGGIEGWRTRIWLDDQELTCVERVEFTLDPGKDNAIILHVVPKQFLIEVDANVRAQEASGILDRFRERQEEAVS